MDYRKFVFKKKAVEESLVEPINTRCYSNIVFSSSEKQYKPLSSVIGEMRLKLKAISELQDGWDGKSAKRISKTVISRTEAIIQTSRQSLFISPTARGTIQIEHQFQKRYVEMEIGAKTIKVCSIDNGVDALMIDGDNRQKIDYFFNFINEYE